MGSLAGDFSHCTPLPLTLNRDNANENLPTTKTKSPGIITHFMNYFIAELVGIVARGNLLATVPNICIGSGLSASASTQPYQRLKYSHTEKKTH